MLTAFATAGGAPLPSPPESWIRKAAAIGRREGLVSKLKRFTARLVYDSWLEPEPVGVRGTPSTDQRRLVFDFQGRVLDLRAEKSKDGWVFVSQLSGAPDAECAVRCGSGTYWPDDNGVCQWTSARPPRKISVRIDNEIVTFPDLKWKKPSSKKPRGDS